VGPQNLNLPMNQPTEELLKIRQEKDEFFKTDPDSPILQEDRATFKGLNYFSPDPAYQVSARLERSDQPEPLFITTSKGSRQSYLKYGKFEFQIRGARLRLTVYKSAEDPFARSLFVPFSDATSGSETYESGRYLDLEEDGGDEYELDFNLAYNPYCAYNDQYTCPVPPQENRLPVKILAGEKNYK
jgi:uncharacterized protein